MEKAMRQSHGIGYADYNRKLENRLRVERRREQDHKESMQMVSNIRMNMKHL
ncbi:hypothetical protein [Anaerobacillus alkaliphilus]|uniref:hypothetical protein n=1 Tax=Anaerobacillus alkaliphilus TaxID=1548597 RepID=UPI0018AC6C69|nr:hypothetical protein [Anaerobacillus alkaliphilus]